MQQKKSYSLHLMLAIVFGFQFESSFSSGIGSPTIYRRLRSVQTFESHGSSNNLSVAIDDDVGFKDNKTQPSIHDELTSYLVKYGLFKKGCGENCPGKCVAHPQTSELICICERGKGMGIDRNRQPSYSPLICADCICGFAEISCSLMDGLKKCYCEIGYENKNGRCVESKRPCEGDRCKNGGTCWENTDGKGYMCTCPETHKGRYCQQDSNSCDKSPCQNSGVCWIGSGSDYLCVCPETHAGKNCQRKIHICDTKPCLNGGTCWRGNGSDHHCACQVNYTGENCQTEVEIDPCASNPCENDGKCWRGEGLNYLCTCKSDYNGKNCDERKSISTP